MNQIQDLVANHPWYALLAAMVLGATIMMVARWVSDRLKPPPIRVEDFISPELLAEQARIQQYKTYRLEDVVDDLFDLLRGIRERRHDAYRQRLWLFHALSAAIQTLDRASCGKAVRPNCPVLHRLNGETWTSEGEPIPDLLPRLQATLVFFLLVSHENKRSWAALLDRHAKELQEGYTWIVKHTDMEHPMWQHDAISYMFVSEALGRLKAAA